MSGLTLTLTDNFDVESIRGELSKHLAVDEPQLVYLKAADPPSVLQLLGNALSWSPLTAAATAIVTVYFSTLAKTAANDTWDALKSILKSNEAKPLADVAKVLEGAANSVTGEIRIGVGLSIPDDYFGTTMYIKPCSSEEIAYRLAFFVVQAEQISKSMKAEIEAGHTPLGGPIIELCDDGSLAIAWVSQVDSRRRRLKISAPRLSEDTSE